MEGYYPLVYSAAKVTVELNLEVIVGQGYHVLQPQSFIHNPRKLKTSIQKSEIKAQYIYDAADLQNDKN